MLDYKNVTKNLLLYGSAGAFLLILNNVSFAASFSVKEQNVTNLGTAYAGTAVYAQDASTAFYNPAGLGLLKYNQVSASFVGVISKAKFTPTAAKNNANAAVTPLDTTVGRAKLVIPSFYYAHKINDTITAGFNVASPFGLQTKYDENNSVARFMATRSELRTFSFGPSLSYKVNDQWYLGGAIDAMFVKAWLDAKANFGAGEGFQKNSASDWVWGFKLGLLYQVSDSMRLGLNYRHKYKVKAKGTSQTVISGVTNANLSELRTVRANINLPESLTYSVYYQHNDKWSLMADVEWMHWSRFKELRLDYEDPNPAFNAVGNAPRITPENYRNVYRLALGSDYKHNDSWTFRGGIAYDQSPTKAEDRTARIPDSNRIWVGLGAQYNYNKNLKLDFGYARLFFHKSSLNEVAPLKADGAVSGNQTLSGNYKSHADLVGIQMTWNFV